MGSVRHGNTCTNGWLPRAHTHKTNGREAVVSMQQLFLSEVQLSALTGKAMSVLHNIAGLE